MSRLKKADSQTSLVMWLGILTCTFISVLWMVPKIQPYHLDLESVNFDLENIQGQINHACISAQYWSQYNPMTEDGIFTIDGSSICINNTISKCRIALCDIGIQEQISLDEITFVVIEKNQTDNNNTYAISPL